MANQKDLIARTITTFHRGVHSLTAGRVGGTVNGMPVLMLTTTGRKSGQARTTPLTYLDDGARIIVIASYGGDDRHPAWYLNLTANPQVEVRTGSRTRTMLARTATADEKVALWPRVVSMYKGYEGYQSKTDRDIPLVILTEA